MRGKAIAPAQGPCPHVAAHTEGSRGLSPPAGAQDGAMGTLPHCCVIHRGPGSAGWERLGQAASGELVLLPELWSDHSSRDGPAQWGQRGLRCAALGDFSKNAPPRGSVHTEFSSHLSREVADPL